MPQSPAKGRSRLSEAAGGLLMLSPTAIYAILLLAVPLAMVVFYSLIADSKIGFSSGLTLSHYAEIWTGRIYRAIMLRSLIVSMLVTLVTVVLAYPVAYFVSFHVAPSKKALWLFLITIPFWTSYLIRVFLWKAILGFNGVINSFLISMNMISEPLLAINYSAGSMVMVLAHAYAPFAVLPIFVTLEKIDRSLLEAGQDLGETKLMTFIRVTLPLSMTGVIAAVLIVFIPTVGDYITPNLIGGGKIPMIANMIEAKMLKQNDMAMGSAIAITAMLIVALVSVIFLLMNKRFLKGQKR